jgi:sugar phosphate isomerase/epimerase
MRLGIFARTFPGSDPATVLASVAAAGYSCTQYNMTCSGLPSMPDSISARQATRVAEASASTGVAIVAVSGTYNMIHPDPYARADGQRRLEVLAARCAELSAGLITLCTGTREPTDQWKRHPDNDTEAAWDDLLAAMEAALSIADRHIVDLGIEPELANVVNSAKKARRLIDTMKSPRLKVVIDPANLFEVATLEQQRDLVSSAIDLLADRIVLAHAKDRTRDGRFTTAGKGVLDYAHYIERLRGAGFTGSVVTHGLSAHEASDVATFLRERLGLPSTRGN